jgi:hypothetical protein
MKYSPLILLLYCWCTEPLLFGQQESPHAGKNKLPAGAYVSINPISLSGLIPSTLTKEVLPYAHNLESGISLAGGYYFSHIQLEGRLVAGSPAALIFCPQIHTGLRYFPLRNKERERIPLGFGLFIRTFDTYYTHSGVHFLNFSIQPQFGYIIQARKFFFDLRIGWDLLVFTSSNLEYSSPKLAFSRFPPACSLNIGYVF